MLFQENLLRFFFHHCFSSVIFVVYLWLLIVLFKATFLRHQPDCFTLLSFVKPFVFILLLLYREYYGFETEFFTFRCFFILHSFPAFGACAATTCFSRLPWAWKLSLIVSRASCCVLKHSPSQSHSNPQT